MEWILGNVKIKNQVVLAPMAGVSNVAYMKICESMGVSYVVTELISAEAIIRNNKKTFDMFKGLNTLSIPFGIQLFGNDPKRLSLAAKIVCEKIKPTIIDINMGCPVPKVAIKNHSGSYLMKEPDKVYEIVKEVVNTVDIPVTVKIRSGWDEKHINAIEIAKICEKAGASAIFIHPRTRKQGYSGKSDWNIIKEVVNNVSIPVIGNGDILSCYDAQKMLDETGCTAVMIGRGALGNPWLIKECIEYLDNKIEPKKVLINEKIEMMKHNIRKLIEIKGETIGILELRTILMYYLKGMQNTKELKLAIIKATTKNELNKLLDNYKNSIVE